MIHCLFRYSTDAGTSSCLWSFNPLLLRLLGEISPSLLCLHNSWGSALDLDPPLRVGCLRASLDFFLIKIFLLYKLGTYGYAKFNFNNLYYFSLIVLHVAPIKDEAENTESFSAIKSNPNTTHCQSKEEIFRG